MNGKPDIVYGVRVRGQEGKRQIVPSERYEDDFIYKIKKYLPWIGVSVIGGLVIWMITRKK